jgi:hypothetical protein
MLGSLSASAAVYFEPFPATYMRIPSPAPSRKAFLKTMTTMKSTGRGTVTHTTYEELLTPLKTQKNTQTHVKMQARYVYPLKIVGSPV